jgi:TonB-dependent starch-binding outer membrane protein SusC
MRFVKYYIVTALLFSFSLGGLMAQEKAVASRVSGRITDNNNKPIAQVMVQVQEENKRTLTSTDGSFTITASAGDILVFSKKGYATVQKMISDAVNINISLQATKIGGGEEDNVVIPFGVRKKREVNYAVSTFNAKELPQIPTSNVLNLLAGRIAGLYVQQANSTPGNENATLQIRGRSTYNGGNSPRILVDGIYREASELDVNEIESVTVLKDAAALTWYGLNAANGVVMINTKKGSTKALTINLTSELGTQQRGSIISPLNSYDYATLYNEGLTNIGQTALYNQAALDAYKNNSDPYLFPNNNYIDRFLKSSSPVQRHVITADGGTSAFRYFTMLSYTRQEGLFTPVETPDFNSNERFQRINFRVNLDYQVNKNLEVGLYAGARTGNVREPLDGGFGLLSDLYNLPPNAFPILNKDGSYGGTTTYRNNPLARLQDRGYIRNLSRSLLVNLDAKQKIPFIKGLSANVLFSYDATGNYTSGLSKDYEVVDFTGTTPAKYRTAAPLNYIGANFNNTNRRNELWLGFDYDREFGSIHKINASIRGQRSVDVAVDRLDYRGQQVAARIDYALMDRYFFGVVGSYAGSENFPPSKRYGFFPAVSAGWIVSEENFAKNVLKNNYIKLRASYGTMGNGDIGGARLPYRTLYRAPAAFGYPFGTSFASTVSADLSIAGNPDITWETLKRTNIGVDFTLLKRALSFSVDFFNDERSNILTTPILPSILGINLTGVNQGVVTSKGWEGALNYDKQFGDFTIGLNANYTYAKNNVASVNEDAGLPDYQTSIGYNTGNVSVINTKRFYVSQGIFQTQAEIDAAPKQLLAGKVVPGDIRYKDINGDNVINSLDAISTNYTDIPNAYYGFGMTLKYKGLQLSGQFQGVQGRTIQLRTIVNSGPANLNALSLDRWTPATAATAKYPRLAISDRGNNDANSDFWLRSGDFLKLRTVELSYSLGQKLSSKLHVGDLKFFLSGYNLLTFSKLDIDVDPEMPSAGYGSAYPAMKTFAAGLNIRF